MPPMNGFRLQLTELCTGLAQRHEVSVLAYGAEAERRDAPAGVELLTLAPPEGGRAARGAATLRALLGRRPRRVGIVTRPMVEALESLLANRDFDLVQVSGPQLAGVSPALGERPSVLAVLDAWHLNVGAEARMAPALKRPLYRLEERNVRRFSATAFRPFRRVVVVSESDAEALVDLDPGLAVAVVPNGVDTEELAPNPEVPAEEGLVVFTGAMHWAPNVEAAHFLVRRVLPLLRERRPGARLAIVGRNPRPDVAELAAIENVEVTGGVPDIRPWLWRAQAFACPMVSGTGIKNKLLEASPAAPPASRRHSPARGSAQCPAATCWSRRRPRSSPRRSTGCSPTSL